MSMGTQAYALNFRDWARSFIKSELSEQRPVARYATVSAVDRVARKATVQFNGETADTVVNLGSIQPAWIGQRVRIKGTKGDRYIDDIVGSVISSDDTDIAFWEYSSLTSMANPSDGFVRLNNATLASVTAIAIAHVDASGTDVNRITHLTAAASQYSFVTLSKAGDPNQVAVYKVSTYADNTTWDQLTCTLVFTTGTFTGNDYLRVKVSPAIP